MRGFISQKQMFRSLICKSSEVRRKDWVTIWTKMQSAKIFRNLRNSNDL